MSFEDKMFPKRKPKNTMNTFVKNVIILPQYVGTIINIYLLKNI